MKKLIASVFAFAMVFALVGSVSAPQAQAQTTMADLQAMITTLQAQLAAMSGGSGLTGAAAQSMFNTDLTMGSKNSDVSSLQALLISKGYAIPAGATGYFGAQTLSAVMKWQADAGIMPAAGYFGPKSRAAVNAMSMGGGTPVGSTVPGCGAGAMFSSTTGAACSGTTTPGGTTGTISTPGVEGTLSITSAPTSGGTVYEGESMREVLAFKAKAQSSDIAIQRVKLDLGTATTIYNKIYSKVYLVDDSGKTLASSDLNSSSVIKEGSSYFITLSGFSYVVSKDTTKTLTVKMDVRNSIDTSDINNSPYTVRLAALGVRGIDGAGIDQFSPALAIDVSKATTVSASLTDSAALTLSANVNNPLSTDVIAADGSADNELLGVTLLSFDVKATKDKVLLTDLVATVTRSAGTATASSTFLWVDGVQIGSASLSGSTATFSDIDYTIAKDSTKTFMLKADIRSASSVITTINASVANAGLTGENTIGDSVTDRSGSATGNNVFVRNIGPEFKLVGSSATRTSVSSNDLTGFATSTGAATFNLEIKAVGGAISFGSVGSTTPMFSTTTSTTMAISRNGATAVSLSSQAAGGTSAVLSYGANPTGSTADTEGFTVPEGATVSIPVTTSLTISANASNNYAFQINGVRWYTAAAGQQTSTSMLNQALWRTSSISLP